MDARQAGRLLGAADSRGAKLTDKNHSESLAPIPGRRQPLGSGATEDRAGSSWTVAAGETQVTREWGSRGRWLGLGLGAGGMAQQPAGMAVSSGFWASRFNPFPPGSLSTATGTGGCPPPWGLCVPGWWPGARQEGQAPSCTED